MYGVDEFGEEEDGAVAFAFGGEVVEGEADDVLGLLAVLGQ